MKDENLLLLVGAGFLAYTMLKKKEENPMQAGALEVGGSVINFGFNPASITQLPFAMGADALSNFWNNLQAALNQSTAPTLGDYQQAAQTGRTVTTPTLNTQRWVSAGANPKYATEEEAYFAGQTVSIEEVMARRNGALFNPQTQKIIQEPVANVIHTEADAIRAGLVHLGTPIGTYPLPTSGNYTPNTVIQREDGNVLVTDNNGTIIHDSSAIINQTARKADIDRLTGR